MRATPTKVRARVLRLAACALLALGCGGLTTACEREAELDETAGRTELDPIGEAAIEEPGQATPEEPMFAEEADVDGPPPVTASELAAPDRGASATEVAGCGDLGALNQVVDDAGGPLLVRFSVPQGFEEASADVAPDEVVATRLERQAGNATIAVELVQSRDAKNAQEIGEELERYTDGERDYNIPAGTSAFGDEQLEIYRSEKPDGRIYSFAVPAGEGELYLTTLYVESSDPQCRAEMQALADQVLASMKPSPAPQIVTQD